MRRPVDPQKLKMLMATLGRKVKGAGRIYFTGGATALLHGWRSMTVDVDLKADPEPPGLFEAIAEIKDALEVNIKQDLIRYPAIDPDSFRARVQEFCNDIDDS